MKNIFLLLTMLLIAASSFAQSATTKTNITQRADRMTKQIKAVVELDLAQEKQIQLITLRSAKQFEEIQTIKATNPELYSAKLNTLKEGMDLRILKELKEEQAITYKAHLQKRASKEKQSQIMELRKQKLQSGN